MSQSTYSKISLILSCVAPLVIAASTLSAQDSNSSQITAAEELQWSSDGGSTMSISENIRTLKLTDNVAVIQGSLEILGDNATLEYDEPTRELMKVTVFGNPVRYSQQLDQDGGSVSGTSDSLFLYTDDSSGDSVIELVGNAYIESPDTTVNCEAIVYLPSLDLIPSTTGPCAGSLSKQQE